jgi:hypothetical protein
MNTFQATLSDMMERITQELHKYNIKVIKSVILMQFYGIFVLFFSQQSENV